MIGRLRPDLPWLLLLLALPALIHLPELVGLASSDPLRLMSGLGVDVPDGLLPGRPGWIDGNAGVTVQALGRLVARDWLAGIVPWWNPWSGIGVPLAGEYQPAAFFLPWVLLLGLPNGVLLLKVALQILAGLSAYGLGRRLDLHHPVAGLVGILFAFNGSFALASDAPIQPMAFLPLILLGIERARAPGASWLPLGLGLGSSLLAGFPETAFLDGVLALSWALLRLRQGPGRNGMALRLGLGVVFGLGLAAPQLVAFLDFLPDAFVAAHAGSAQVHLPPAALAMWLMPWLHGPILFGRQDTLWFALGGYLGAGPLLLALLGLVGRRERGLRLLLAGWVVLVVGRSAGWPLISEVADSIPLMAHTIVSRYATASAGLATIVLAGFGLEDWRRGRTGYRMAAALVAVALIVGICLVIAWPTSRAVMGLPGGAAAWALSLLLLVGVTLALAVLLARPPSRRRLGGSVAVMALETLLLFSVPLLSTRRGGDLDTGTIAYLKAHLGLQRFTTLGATLVPNYGAYWELASINHNLIPLPAVWAGHVQAAIDPAAEPLQFYGADPGFPDGARADALRRHLPALQALGVAYLLQDHDHDRLTLPALPPVGRADTGWAGLGADGTLEASYPADGLPRLDAGQASVVIGTFMGQARGLLQATLCRANLCARGTARLDDAADNAPLPIALDRSLPVAPGQPIQLTLHHAGPGTVAIWLWQGAGTALPRLALAVAGSPVLVHVGRAADIYALPHPAPYAEAGTGCRVTPISRTRIDTDCDAPARLVRRELFLRGWQARVGHGQWRAVQREGKLFQAVMLPAGHAVVRFAYAPPDAPLGWAGLMLAGSMVVVHALRATGWLRGARLARRNAV